MLEGKPFVINLLPKEPLLPCREGSRQQLFLEALAKGIKFHEIGDLLVTRTGEPWTKASIMAMIHYDMNQVKGYGIRTEIDSNGVHSYHLVLPKGVSKTIPPLPVQSRRGK